MHTRHTRQTRPREKRRAAVQLDLVDDTVGCAKGDDEEKQDEHELEVLVVVLVHHPLPRFVPPSAPHAPGVLQRYPVESIVEAVGVKRLGRQRRLYGLILPRLNTLI